MDKREFKREFKFCLLEAKQCTRDSDEEIARWICSWAAQRYKCAESLVYEEAVKELKKIKRNEKQSIHYSPLQIR